MALNVEANTCSALSRVGVAYLRDHTFSCMSKLLIDCVTCETIVFFFHNVVYRCVDMHSVSICQLKWKHEQKY